MVGRGHLDELAIKIREQHRDVPDKEINKVLEPGGKAGQEKRRHLSTEEVQHVKELLAQVGSLSFVMVANQENDKVRLSRRRKTNSRRF